jgi:hypothetical protein
MTPLLVFHSLVNSSTVGPSTATLPALPPSSSHLTIPLATIPALLPFTSKLALLHFTSKLAANLASFTALLHSNAPGSNLGAVLLSPVLAIVWRTLQPLHLLLAPG